MTAVHADEQFVLDADSLPFAVMVFDASGNVVRTNRMWTELTGQTQQRASTTGWLRAIVPSDRPNAALVVRAVLAGDGPRMAEWRLQPSRRHPQRWARARLEPSRGVDGSAVGCYAFIEDSDEEHNRGLQLEYQATHDALTGVLNRAQFVDHTRRALSRLNRHPGTIAVVFIDLDHFKEVNDVHGHVFGDRVLAALAHRFHRAVRPSDVVARYGGDEFVVLCEELGSPEEARAVGERIVIDLSQPYEIDGENIRLHASVGVVTTDDPRADLMALLTQADLAMYRAKQHGPDRVEVEPLLRNEDDEVIIDLELEHQRDWQNVLLRIHHQLRDAEAALGRLWADELPHPEAATAGRLADAARYVSRAVRALADDVIA